MNNEAFHSLLERILQKETDIEAALSRINESLEKFYKIFSYVEKKRKEKEKGLELTFQDLRDLIAEKAHDANRTKLFEIFQEFQINHVSELKPEDYYLFADRINTI